VSYFGGGSSPATLPSPQNTNRAVTGPASRRTIWGRTSSPSVLSGTLITNLGTGTPTSVRSAFWNSRMGRMTLLKSAANSSPDALAGPSLRKKLRGRKTSQEPSTCVPECSGLGAASPADPAAGTPTAKEAAKSKSFAPGRRADRSNKLPSSPTKAGTWVVCPADQYSAPSYASQDN
jgi:hypothetical protein